MRVNMVHAESKDLEALFEIERLAFKESADRFNEEEWKEYDNFLISPSPSTDPVGYFSISLHRIPRSWDRDERSEGCIFLAGVGVIPSYQRMGVALATMEWLIAYARASSFYRIVSNYRVSNTVSKSFHARCGFVPVATIPNFYASPTEDAVVVDYCLNHPN